MTYRVTNFISGLPGDASHEAVRDNMLDVIRGRCLDASGDGEKDTEIRRLLDRFYSEQRKGRFFVNPRIFSGADRT